MLDTSYKLHCLRNDYICDFFEVPSAFLSSSSQKMLSATKG
ncbi:hypothetical protein OIU78_016261 [Salix suchowensis]|nr:hypothetical protein OIU78_016261 [Salix suchowensis]